MPPKGLAERSEASNFFELLTYVYHAELSAGLDFER